MTFESTRRETQELQPIKTPTDILTRLTDTDSVEGKKESRRKMSVLDENVLTC